MHGSQFLQFSQLRILTYTNMSSILGLWIGWLRTTWVGSMRSAPDAPLEALQRRSPRAPAASELSSCLSELLSRGLCVSSARGRHTHQPRATRSGLRGRGAHAHGGRGSAAAGGAHAHGGRAFAEAERRALGRAVARGSRGRRDERRGERWDESEATHKS